MKKSRSDRIQFWFDIYKVPPVEAIRDDRDHYAGLWIKPWYKLNKKNPPLPVFQEMLDAFSRMYDEWDKAFKEAGNPYDLQLWIYDEHMIESQLVCAGVENTGDRRTNYFHDCPEQYKFQTEKYKKSASFDPDDFEWTTYEVRDYLYEKTDELSPKYINKLLALDWREEKHCAGTDLEERCFWRIYDYVWIGRKK
ncbi:MAG: hypothetical protein U9O95_08010 [Candidatus Marinimicrobia bacterium]|nr:hypothetical protein [Candidatus Neomarinimicrobiota bacterium]